MRILIILALAFHVVPAVFWAGTTFVLARSGGIGAEKLFRPQMGAALVAFVTGAFLWSQLHAGGFNAAEQTLALGALCALAAAGVQGSLVGRAVGRLRTQGGAMADVQSSFATAHRIAAPLLVVTLVCMVIARYVG
jgi:hypothetical protein